MANYQKFEGLREEAKMNFNEKKGGESAIRWNLHKVESAMAESAANGGRWQSKSNQVGHLKVCPDGGEIHVDQKDWVGTHGTK